MIDTRHEEAQPSAFRRFAPWVLAAGFAVAAGWAGLRYQSEQSATIQLRRQHALADVALQSVRQQLEAERIVTRRQLQDLDQQANDANTRLAQVRNQLERVTAELESASSRTGDSARRLAESERQLTAARTAADEHQRKLADRDIQLLRLSQRIDALNDANAHLTRQLETAREQIGQLTEELKIRPAVADFKITVLASMAKEIPQARGVAVWDPTRKEGVLRVEKLPVLQPNQDYQLWVVDPQYPDRVDGGVFSVDPQTNEARFIFKPKRPVSVVNAFAISRERKGGVARAEGPIVLQGQ